MKFYVKCVYNNGTVEYCGSDGSSLNPKDIKPYPTKDRAQDYLDICRENDPENQYSLLELKD